MPHYVLHQFRPTETIDAVIRLKIRHDLTQEELLPLRKRFNELNGLVVPRAGQTFKIPLEPLVVDDYGNLVDASRSAFLSVLKDSPVVQDPGEDGQQPPEREHPGDPRQPVNELPPEPGPGREPEEATKQNGDQHVPPDPGKDPSQGIQEKSIQGTTLLVSGTRRSK
jgi:hypothetical protein